MQILILNGPNLNLLGIREKSIYGSTSMDEFMLSLNADFPNVEFEYFQSNSEGSIIDKIHQVGFEIDGIVLNAAAYTHTSVAIADAIAAVPVPVIEVHISNTAKREEFRHKSFIAPKCVGTITGFGLNSYRLAIHALLLMHDSNNENE